MMRRWMLLACLSLVFVSAASFPSHAQSGSEIFPYGRPTKLSEYRTGFHCGGNNILPLINNRGDVTWYCQNGLEHWGFFYDSTTSAVSELGSIYGWGPSPSIEGWDPDNLNDTGQGAFCFGNGLLYDYEDGNGTFLDTPSGSHAGYYQINDQGQIAYSGYNWSTGFWEVWRYDTADHTATQISQGGGGDGRINNQGDIVWRKALSPYEYEIHLYEDGGNTTLRTGCLDRPRLNDLGHAVWSEYDGGLCNESGGDYEIYFHDGANAVPITANAGGTDWHPQINNRDQIVWWGTNLTDPEAGLTYEIFLYDHATRRTTQITSNHGDDILPEINDVGQIVWQGTDGIMGYSNPSEIYLYSNGMIYQLTNDNCTDENPQINNKGQIVWQRTCPGEGTEVYMLKPLINAKLSENRADFHCGGNNILPLINNRGDVTWYCQKGLEHWGFFYDSTTSVVSELGSIYGWGPSPSYEGWDPRNLNDTGRGVFCFGNGLLYDYEDGNGVFLDTPSGSHAGYYQINDQGQIVYSGYNWSTGLWEVWRYDTADHTATQISQGGGGDGRINNQGDIVWRKALSPYEYEIFLYEDGGNTTLRTGCIDRPRLNDLGHAVWSEYDGGLCNESGGDYEIYFHDGANAIALTDNVGGTDWHPQINNRDQIVWWGTNLTDPEAGLTYEIFLYDHATRKITQITSNHGDDILPEINDVGQIVWQGTTGLMGYSNPSEIYLYSNGMIYQLTNDNCTDENPQINNQGKIVWQRTCPGEGTEIFMTMAPMSVLDSDGDGVTDADDGCPEDFGKTAPGFCGCGVVDVDQVTVTAETSRGGALSGARLYVFSASGSYLGLYATTDGQGAASFSRSVFADGAYKFRLDHLGQQFWSNPITVPGTCAVHLVIPVEIVEVTVSMDADPAPGFKVYVFSGSGGYLGQVLTTDVAGKVQFQLPVGKTFKFRADILGSQYWSDAVTVAAGGINQVPLNAGGGDFQVTLLKGPGSPMAGIKTYLFSTSGGYLGLSMQSDPEGKVAFAVPQGTYRVRVDYLGYQFWTPDFPVSGDTAQDFTIPHQPVLVTVQGVLGWDIQPRSGLSVYLFHPSGSYLGLRQTSDGGGRATFELPEQPYRVRLDCLGGQFWSEEFTAESVVVHIPEGNADVHVVFGGQGVAAVPVYVFSTAGSYLGVHGSTDSAGLVSFRLPAATYQFRADYQGNQFWATAAIARDTSNTVEVNTGGGPFVLTVDNGLGALVGAKVYAFKENGSYLGLNGTTDIAGQVNFNLANGRYKFRVDHLGYQFWTSAFEVPVNLSGVFSIPHQDVTITVAGLYLTPQPLQSVKVYLFTSSGSYQGQVQTTDVNGQVVFTVPNRSYKVRADYLGYQFWSEVFTGTDTALTVTEGLARIHVHGSGTAVSGAKVYLFSAGGSYLGRVQTTDAGGYVTFQVPDRGYKFRADVNGKQYWTPVVTTTAGGEMTTELDVAGS